MIHFWYTSPMPTLKRRINITTDSEIESALLKAARRDRMPLAAKAADLLRLGLEIEEDLAFAKLADFRMSQKVKFVSHDRAWK